MFLTVRHWAILLLLLCTGAAQSLAQRPVEPRLLTLEGDLTPIHDPAIIREGDTYYVFASNRFQQKLVPIFCSKDLLSWKFCGNVFAAIPEWARTEVPGTRGIWAPDISYVDGQYRLYYSVSTFGSNHSVIGLITNQTLNSASPDYAWVDQGKVIGSTRSDDWNAIDANLFMDVNGEAWLSWGSFWGGIKMRKLDRATGKLSSSDTTLYSLASRKHLNPPSVEAPFIVRRGNYYYLFVSFDMCCKGKDSTYKVMVGRSNKVTGPYKDKDGVLMMNGGGTLLIEGNDSWKGPGHQAVLLGKNPSSQTSEPKSSEGKKSEGKDSVAKDSEADLLVFHSYNATTGRPSLYISTLTWFKGWPLVAKLPPR